MLVPQKHFWINSHVILVYIFGALLFVAGMCLAVKVKVMETALLLGSVLLLIFCFYFIPYEFIVSPNYMHFGDWENAAKELTLSSGAFVIADCFSTENKHSLIRFLRRLTPLGVILFPLTILSYGVNHFLYAKDAAGYIPSWVPGHMFWIYFTGSALICSAVAILLRVKVRLAAALLGTMILIWVIILHIPNAVASSIADKDGEVSSAFLALAYCGIAFVIAGSASSRR